MRRSCTVSPHALTILSCLSGLRELSFDSWQTVGAPAAEAEEDAAAETTVCGALVELLAGPVGERLEVLRMDLSDPSNNIYSDMPQ